MVFLIFCESYDNNIRLKFTVKGFDFLLVFIKLCDNSCNNAQTGLLNVAVSGGIFRVNQSRHCSHIIKLSATGCRIEKMIR